MDSQPNAIVDPEVGQNILAMQQIQQQQTNVMLVGMTNVTQVEQTHVTVVKRDKADDDSEFDAWCYIVVAIIFIAITILIVFLYLAFMACKYLVLFMIVEENIAVEKPVLGTIMSPVLDLSMRFLYFLSNSFQKLANTIQDNLVIIFFIRVMVNQVFDLVIILYLNIEAPITVYWVLYMLVAITFCSVMIISLFLNFCCRNGLNSACNRLDAINSFNTMFFQFKLFSFLSSLILLINEVDFNARFGPNSLVTFCLFVTCLDLFFIILTFIAMFVKYLNGQNKVENVQQPQETE